jgi:hypothetical protein
MSLPRVRFTVRQVMMSVAVVATLLFSGIMLRRRADFVEKAENCEASYEVHRHDWQEFHDAAEENRGTLDRLQRGEFSDHRDLDPDRHLGSDLSLPELIARMRRLRASNEADAVAEEGLASHSASL